MIESFKQTLPQISHGDHCCLLFSAAQEQIQITAPFLAIGLERDERVVYVGDSVSVEQIRFGLKNEGVNVEKEAQKNRLVLSSDRDYLDRGRFSTEKMLAFLQQAYDSAMADKFTALRAAGDVSWQVGPERDFGEVVYYETLLDLFFLGKKMVGMCQYPKDHCPSDTLIGILNTHRIAAVDSSIGANFHYAPPQLLLEKNLSAREKNRMEWMTAQLLRVRRAESAREKAIDELIREKEEMKRVSLEKKNLQEQLLQSQKMEAIGRLAGGVAHDFNNLLTVILINYSMLAKKLGTGIEELEEIKKSAGRAAALTRQLLAFSRKQIFSPAVVNLNALVENAQKMLSRVIGEDVDLVTRLAPDLGQIEADPSQVEQVLMNLVVNARDAMPQGGKLTLETKNVELDETSYSRHFEVRPGPYVMVSVTDTGMGMDKATQEQIFEPFFTTKEKGKGTGLGLATVYGIVKQSRGDIWVYSEPGLGSTFKIHFPRIKPQTAVPEKREVPVKSLSGSETVLLAEDEDGVRRLASKILKQQGYRVLEAKNGMEAMALFERHGEEVHLVLTDTVMPQMNGHELVRRLRSARPGFKAVLMSGYSEPSAAENGISEMRIEFIEKPFTPEMLARKIREVLDQGKEKK